MQSVTQPEPPLQTVYLKIADGWPENAPYALI